MGRSIDEHIAQLKMLRSYNMIYRSYGASINYALDIISKYQKIVEIVSLNNEEFKQCGLKELKEILEVIADGNVD